LQPDSVITNYLITDSLNSNYISFNHSEDYSFFLDQATKLGLADKHLSLPNKLYDLTLQDFFNINLSLGNSNQYYDFIRLEETSDSTGNIRFFNSTTPLRLVKGILNQHNLHILQSVEDVNNFNKLIFLQFKINNSGELNKDKELIPETL